LRRLLFGFGGRLLPHGEIAERLRPPAPQRGGAGVGPLVHRAVFARGLQPCRLIWRVSAIRSFSSSAAVSGSDTSFRTAGRSAGGGVFGKGVKLEDKDFDMPETFTIGCYSCKLIP
jgi:hypothetical protein